MACAAWCGCRIGLGAADWDPAGRLVVPTGLVRRVVGHLRSLGYTVAVSDQRMFGPAHIPDGGLLNTCTADERAFAEAITTRTMGQIEVRNQQDLVARIDFIARLYPSALIAVVVPRRRQARNLYRRLPRRLRDSAAIILRPPHDGKHRVMVMTYSALADLAALGDEPLDILLLAVDADAVDVVPTTTHLVALRAYGLVPQHLHLGARGRLELEAYCGPLIYRVPQSGRAVRAYLADCYFTPRTNGLDGLTYKRAACWANPRRNAVIARIATAFGSGDLNTLWASQVLLDCPDWQSTGLAEQPRVAVLVESKEHGRALHRLLPGWDLVSAADGLGNGQPVSQRSRSIVTITRAYRFGLDANVIVAASGAEGLLQLPSFPPPSMPGPNSPLILIDICSSADRLGRLETERRITQWRRHGWLVEGRLGRTRTPGPASDTTAPTQPCSHTEMHNDDSGHQTATGRLMPTSLPVHLPAFPDGKFASRVQRLRAQLAGSGALPVSVLLVLPVLWRFCPLTTSVGALRLVVSPR